MKQIFLIITAVFFFCSTTNCIDKIPGAILGLENECTSIDLIYEKLDKLTRDGEIVVYVNREGVFENPAHQLNIYKFCYDVNVELNPHQKALLAHYHAQKAYNAVGSVIREVPDQPKEFYNQCAEQTGMVVETIACALTPYPQCGDVLTGIAESYARTAKK